MANTVARSISSVDRVRDPRTEPHRPHVKPSFSEATVDDLESAYLASWVGQLARRPSGMNRTTHPLMGRLSNPQRHRRQNASPSELRRRVEPRGPSRTRKTARTQSTAMRAP